MRLKLLTFFFFAFILLFHRVYAYEINVETNNNGILYPDQGNLGANRLADIDGDGNIDLITTACCTTVSGNSAVGSIWILFNVNAKTASKNQEIDLSNPNNYNLRINGSGASRYFAGYWGIGDIDNDGKDDILANEDPTTAGVIYIFKGSSLAQYKSSTGNIISVSDSSNYYLKIIGPANDAYLTIPYAETRLADINNDGKDDVLLHADSNNGSSFNGSVYVLYNNLINQFSGTGNTLALNNSANFNIRYDGPTTNGYFGAYGVGVWDLNNNQKNDLVLGDQYGTVHGAYSGSTFIIFDSLIESLSDTGNIVNLATTSNFTIRIDGASVNDSFGFTTINSVHKNTDINNDDKNDLIIGSPYASYNARTNSGSIYFFDNSLIASKTGTGNIMDLNTPSNFSLRIDGSTANETLSFSFMSVGDFKNNGKVDLFAPSEGNYYNRATTYIYEFDNSLLNIAQTGITKDLNTETAFTKYQLKDNSANEQANLLDINNDGKLDLFISGDHGDYGAYTDTGHTHIFLNFPHTISLNSPPSNINNSSFLLNGLITAPLSVTTIGGVQFNLDSNNPSSSNWQNCTAQDHLFNSNLEQFSCLVQTVSEGSHRIYVRAYDSLYSYTAPTYYGTATFTTDLTSPSSDWNNTNGEYYHFNIQSPDDYTKTDNKFPEFVFSQAKDSLTGIAKYQVVFDNGSTQWVYIDNIPADEPPTSQERDGDNFKTYYDITNHTVKVHAKSDQPNLSLKDGPYKWFIRAVDRSGNYTATQTRTLLINVNTAVFSSSHLSFPLSLLQIGDKSNINISSLHADAIPKKSLVINNNKPTFYGITNSAAHVKLVLIKQHESYDETFNYSTTSNDQSRFGINVNPPLAKGEYQVKLSATNDSGDYVEIPKFNIIIK